MGDSIKVSAFKNAPDGSVPELKYGKRELPAVPSWNPQNCIQCNLCSYVCPHSAIRPFLLDGKESDASPAAFKKCAAKGKGLEGYMYTMQVSPLDCMGCGSCVHVCPSKNKALTMKPAQSQTDEINNWEYALKITQKDVKAENITVKNSQFRQPLLEFPGACPGCGETPYAKLVTQLFGDRMYIATATGCPLVWSTDYPSFPYTTNSKGHGPSQSNSLFENNAEFGLGIALGVKQLRERLRLYVKDLAGLVEDTELKRLAADWVQNYMDADLSRQIGLALVEKLKSIELSNEAKRLADYIKNNAKHLTKNPYGFLEETAGLMT